MVQKVLSHKSYNGSIEVSIEDGCLHGRIQFIEDIISYEGDTVAEIQKAFEEAVDRYLAYCEETGTPANKPYSGTFNIRTSQEIHRSAAQAAFEADITLNEWVGMALQQALDRKVDQVEHHHRHTVVVTVDDENRQSWVTSTNYSLMESFHAQH